MKGYKKCKECGRFSRDKICPKCGKKHGWLDLMIYINDKRDFIESRCPKCGDRYTKSGGSNLVICINPKCGFSDSWSKFKPIKQVQPKKAKDPNQKSFLGIPIRIVDPEKELVQGINPIMNKINADRFAQGEAKRAAAKAETTAQEQLEEMKKQNALLKKLLEEKNEA